MNKLTKTEDAYALVWAKKIRAIDLLGNQCTRCECDNMFVMEFHHPQDDKLFTMNQLRDRRWSLIESEIKKCILLCHNCHQDFHSVKYGRNKQLKQKLLELKKINCCEKCGYNTNISVLHFHHIQEKLFNVNPCRMRYPDVNMENLLLEMDKCQVLCGNCHTMEHIRLDQFNRLRPYIDYKLEHYKELRSQLDKELIHDMYFNQGLRQVDIVKHFSCSKSTISGIVKALKNKMML